MRKGSIFALMVCMMVMGFALAAIADGDGSPEACKTPQQMTGTVDHQTYTAPAGSVVTGVCIKSGQLHTGVLGNGAGACYTVAGVGTSEASVARTGQPGPDCQELSHVDVLITRNTDDTTTTTVLEETTTTPPDDTTTTTEVVEETTTTAGEETTTTEGDDTTTTTLVTVITPPAPPELPFTGIENAPGLWVAGLLAIMAGVGLVWRARSE